MAVKDDTIWYLMSTVILSDSTLDDLWQGLAHFKLGRRIKRAGYLDIAINHLQQTVRIYQENTELAKALGGTEAEKTINELTEEFVRKAKVLLEYEEEKKARDEEAAGLGKCY